MVVRIELKGMIWMPWPKFAVAPEKYEVTLDIRVRNQNGVDVVTARLTGYMPAAEWGVPERPRPSESQDPPLR